MKTSMYLNYTTRSLLRGGQRTVLALFCVAVGVMAIVALQLVGLMINNAFTSNVRDANGGDIAVTSNTKPFTSDNLAYFDQLKGNGTITNYTAYTSATGSLSNASSITDSFMVQAVDPTTYPVVTPPTFVNPSGGSIASLLTGNAAIVDQPFAEQFHKAVGDTFDVHVGSNAGTSERLLQVRIAGIVPTPAYWPRQRAQCSSHRPTTIRPRQPQLCCMTRSTLPPPISSIPTRLCS